ncbi:glycoside hydrolase family 28 protein [Cellulosimicrobium terreum]|nr:glycoside hydrolase family 28 protein [Cellulosimicrobium terreum]
MPTHDIRELGATPGALVTASIQDSIDAAASAGGGRVLIPAGTWRTGALRLRSHVELHLESGARLAFVEDRDLYPVVDARWEGALSRIYSPCLYAHGETDVAITGFGTIDGGGQPWWDAFRHDRESLAHPRPTLVGLHECRRVTIRDVTLRDSPSWTVHPLLCEDVTITNVRILNPADSPNTDGIDPESCTNVRISDCHIDVGDDCIAVKAGSEATPERVACENITITGCTMVHGHGGVVIGSEMSGGVRNVVISSCVFQGTDRGIRVKSRRGRGGVVEDVRVTNVVMDDVMCPFVLNTAYFCGPGGKDPVVADPAPQPLGDGTPLLRRIHLAHVTARGVHASAGYLRGLPEQPLADITLEDVRISFAADPVPGMPAMATGVEDVVRSGFQVEHTQGLVLSGVHVDGCVGPGVRADAASTVRSRDVRINGVYDD